MAADRASTAFERGLTRVHAIDAVEVRDPSASTTPVRYVTPGRAQINDWDADQAIRFGYYANVIAFRCVQIRAHLLSSLPFRVGADPDRPLDHNPAHPLARLLGPAPGGPAPGLAARKLWAWTAAQRIVTGRNAWELELDGDRIVALWPLASKDLKAIPTQSGVEWFRAFEYGPPHDPVTLSADRVFYGWDPSAGDFRQPESALQAARYDLSIAVEGDRYSYSFLKNGAVPAAVVVTPSFPNEQSRQRFRNQWHAQYRGVDNAGKTAFHEAEADGDPQGKIGDSIDVKVLGLSAKDGRFVEQHRAALEMVAIDLGVPWSRLDASGRTFDNAAAEDVLFWEQTMLPFVRTLEDEINIGLTSRFGASDVGWFDLSKVRALQQKPEPLTARVGAPTMVQAQLMTIDEARADYGLPPLPDGAGARMMTVEEIAALRGTVDPAADPAARAALIDDISTRVTDLLPAPPAPAPTRTRPAPESRQMDPDQLEQRRGRLWGRADKTARRFETLFVRAMTRLFARQAEATLRRLTGKRGRQAGRRDSVDAASIFDPDFWESETAQVAQGLYETVAGSVAVRLADDFGIDFGLDNPRLAEFIQARANQLGGQVTSTTYEQIRDALAEGATDGDSIDELAERVRHVFDVASSARAETIARTEVISAMNGTTAEFAALAGDDVVAGQEWISTRDGRTREDHAGADGQIVGPAELFDVGGEQLAYPGDPNGSPGNTVNCRCAVVLLTPEDLADITGEAAPGRVVPVGFARAALSLAAAGTPFDEIRTAIREVAAA